MSGRGYVKAATFAVDLMPEKASVWSNPYVATALLLCAGFVLAKAWARVRRRRRLSARA